MKKRVSVFVVICIFMNLIYAMPVSAYNKSELQQKLISAVYNGAGGRLSCDFDGYTSTVGRHEGIDIALYKGANVYSVIDGEVTAARTASGGLTTIAIYNSEYNLTVIYLHSQNFAVSVGNHVSKGQLISHEGTGGTSSAHTHVEIRLGRQSYASVSQNDSKLDNPDPYPYWEKILNSAPNPVNLGDDFYAHIINSYVWMFVTSTDSDDVRSYSSTGNLDQQWHFVRQSDNSYEITSVWNGKCLDVDNAGTANNTNVKVHWDNDSDAQRWFIYDNSGSYKLRAKCTNCVLDLENGSSDEGANIQMYEQHEHTGQNFQILKIDTPPANLGSQFYGVILNTKPWKPISVDNDGYVKLATENGYANQVWKFERCADGTYKIISALDGSMLDVETAGDENRLKLHTWPDDTNANNQRFYFYGEGDGYVIRPKSSANRVLDCAWGGTTDGTQIQIYDRDNVPAQIFSVYKEDDVQLKPTTVSVSVDGVNQNASFSWKEVYGESRYDVKIWKNTLFEGDAYHVEWGAKNNYSLKLPPGTYQAYVDAANEFECKMSNTVTFTIPDFVSTGKKLQKGDANGDGVVNEEDITYIADMIVGNVTPTKEQIDAADLNGDGKVSMNDAVWLDDLLKSKPAPTPTPTPKPTLRPTATPKPTAKPTATPKPTPAPTPTPKPTLKPTATPKPTAKPTATPKPTPTSTPKPTPTLKPTAVPTAKPTIKPTAAPKPTVKPTATPKPTAKPTPKPTPKPTSTPASTLKPTAVPTAKPTIKPTAVPKPTLIPTDSPEPTAAPIPTSAPTTEPTSTPTLAPAEKPVYNWEINDYQSGVVTITAPRSEKATICIAKYRGDILTDSEVIDLAALAGVNNIHTAKALEPESGENLKIMLWSENLEPLAEPICR